MLSLLAFTSLLAANVYSQSECTTTAEYNVQFVIDESGSVGKENYAATVDFVQTIISNDITDDAPVSVLSFGSNAGNSTIGYELIYLFSDDQSSRNGVLDALENSKHEGSATPTRTALEGSLEEWERAANAGQLNNGERILFLITDGVPFPDEQTPCVQSIYDKIGELNVRIIILGIGDFDITTIECVAFNDDDIYQVGGFSDAEFQELENEISTVSCPPDDGCTTTTEYNVQIIIDESGSVGEDGFDASVEFVKSLIQNEISPTAPVSAYSFGGEGPDVELIYQFNDDQTSRSGVLGALDAADHDGGQTPTRTAMITGIEEYKRAINEGDLNNGERLLILITDGQPVPISQQDPCITTILNDIANLNIRVIILGIGGFDATSIACLADPDDIILTDDFTEAAFDELEAEISTISCPDDDDEPIVSPPIELGCQEAQKYCKDNFGTNLATIATDEDRAEAISILGPSTEAWIGLYSHETQTNWQFRSGEDCPSASAYKCVDFWLYQMNENTALRPRCIGPTEQGYECANFKTGEDGVDNDIPSMIQLPFLCDN